MSDKIFATWAMKYWEMGYNVVPITRGHKETPPVGWTVWTSERVPLELVEQWADSRPFDNIAIVCGKHSGIVIDIDTDDEDVLAVAPLAECNMIRRNSKGFALHFKYTERPNSPVSGVYDLLTKSKYCLVPPSVIYETQSTYSWVRNTNLVPYDELNEIDPMRLNKWVIDAQKFYKPRRPRTKKVALLSEPADDSAMSGRNNKINQIAWCRAKDIFELGLDVDQCIDMIIEYDNKWHSPPWLSDKSEAAHHCNNPRRFVGEMISRHLKTFGNPDDTRVPLFEVDLSPDEAEQSYNTERDARIEQQAIAIEKMIPKNGIFALFNRECEQLSNKRTPVMNFAASLSLCSVLAANKLVYKKTWPNLYIVSLAPSGSGKNTPQTIIKQILSQCFDGEKLMGVSSYASTRGFLGYFTKKRERVDILDEATELFAKMRDIKGNANYIGLKEAFLKAFSDAPSMMSEIAAQTAGAKIPTIHNPCLSVLASGVTDAFYPTLSGELIQQGFLGRWLTFMSPPGEAINKELDGLPFGYGAEAGERGINPDLIAMAELWTSRQVKQALNVPCADGLNFPVSVESIVFDESVIFPLSREINAEIRALEQRASKLGFLSAPSYARAFEMMNKLMVCYCVSQDTRTITPEIMRWAYDLWTAQFNFVKAELEVQSFSSDQVEVREVELKFEAFIKNLAINNPSKRQVSMLHRDLCSRQFMRALGTTFARNQFLEAKARAGLLKLVTPNDSNKLRHRTVVFEMDEFDLK